MNEMIRNPANNPPAPGGDPFARIAAELTQVTRTTFAKNGEWIAHYNSGAAMIPLGREFVALMADYTLAWTKWLSSKPVERRLTRVADGGLPPPRGTLGDTDQSLWEKDDEGRLRDPWQATNELPLLDQETGELLVYVTGTVGGKDAIGKLCGAYSRGRGRHPNHNPVVALGAGGYQHKIKSRGYINVPTLKIVSWVPQDPNTETPKAALTDVMNDALPF
jgi:hypothetical protein